MTQSVSSIPQVTPSTQSSVPVGDILQRIQVRDPNRKFAEGYHRRKEDFELSWQTSPAMVLCFALALAGAAMLMVPRHPTGMAPEQPLRAPSVRRKVLVQPRPLTLTGRPAQEAPLSIPTGLHPQAPVPEQTPGDLTAGLQIPKNFHVNFIGPRSIEFRWDSLGSGYHYLVYSGKNAELADAEALLDHPVESTTTFWTPDDAIQAAWVAVKAIDPAGNVSAFSQPILVQLPRA